MIVACPQCSHPFEIQDDHIAALVQIACPHCSFAMILDFEAANDPSLVEEGMRMASGWRSAGDYHASISGATAERERRVASEAAPAREAPAERVLRVAPVPTPPPEPAKPVEAPRPAATPTPAPAAARPVAPTSPAPAPRPSVSPSVRPPVEPRAPEPSLRVEADEEDEVDVDAEEPETIARPEPDDREAAPVVQAPPADRSRIEVSLDDSLEDEEGPTQIHTPSLREVALPREAAQETVVTPARTGGTTVGPAPTGPLAQPRVAAHTPPVQPASVLDEPPAARSAPARPAPRFESIDLDEEEEPRSSMFGSVVVVLLLLMALGLVGASVALEGTPDPRPLLEKLYRGQLP